MKENADRELANRRIVRRLAMVALLMFGFCFALVPLYNVFCDVTGLNGKTGRIDPGQALTAQVDKERLVTVEFLGMASSDLPWEFRPMVRQVRVHPGEVTEVHYFARNRTGSQVTGQAVPSVAPGQAAKYFNKTECFCFTRQTLQAGESKEMPVRFMVDPALPEDVVRVSLSYTFFRAQDAAPAAAVSMGKERLENVM